MGRFYLILYHVLIFFIAIVIPSNIIWASQNDSQLKQLEQLKVEHKQAMSVFDEAQKKFPGRDQKTIVGQIDNKIKAIEKNLRDLKLYHEGISLLNTETEKSGWTKKAAKFGARLMINEKLSKYNLEINDKADLFLSPEMYNKYQKSMMFVASANSGFNIPIPAVAATQKVKIANLKKSGVIQTLLNNLRKAKETGHQNIQQLTDQKKTIKRIKPLEEKIAALEKQIPVQKKKNTPSHLKKVKSIEFKPAKKLIKKWPYVPIDTLVTFRLLVVYEDGSIVYDPGHKLISGTNRLYITSDGEHRVKARIQLLDQKKIFPVEIRFYGVDTSSYAPSKIINKVGSPFKQYGAFHVKETDGQIKIPLFRIGSGRTTFTADVKVNGRHSTAEPDKDYQLRTHYIEWKDYDKSNQFVYIFIIDDDLSEGNEKIELNIQYVNDQGDKDIHVLYVVIEDDERGGILNFVKSTMAVPPEQNTVTVGIERKGLSAGKVGVEVSTLDDTAQKGKEYFGLKKRVYWPDSVKTEQYVTIDLMKHKRSRERTFWLVLKTPSGGARIGDIKKVKVRLLKKIPSAQKTLPSGPVQVKFTQASYTVKEDGKIAIISVSRSGDSAVPLSIRWKIYDGNTDINLDYVSDYGILNWQANDSQSKIIRIQVMDDHYPERLEYAYIELYNPQSSGSAIDIKGQNPVKLFITDNDHQTDKTQDADVTCHSIKIKPGRLLGRPGQTFQFNQTFLVIALMSDNSEVDITRDPALVWEPAPRFTFPRESKFNERLDVGVRYMDCRATARIDVEYPFWSDPISDADDLEAKAGQPPADAYDWYVVCNKKTLDVVYTQQVDLIRHMVIEGPFAGPREPAMWIEANCPRAKCNKTGQCSQGTAVRGGSWGVYCNLNSGLIVVTKDPQSFHKKLEGNFHSLTEGQLWSEQQYPSGLCDSMGRYLEEGFGEISSSVGGSMPSQKEKDEFARIGGESTMRILDESSEATALSQGGKKGFSLHNFENAMGPESKKRQQEREKQAQAFLKEFLERTTKDFTDYQQKKAEQKKKARLVKNQPSSPNQPPAGSGAQQGKNYINSLKCKNAGQYLNNAIKVKNIKAAREILNEIKYANCEYYAHAKAQVDKLETLIAKKYACEDAQRKIRQYLIDKKPGLAKRTLNESKNCPGYTNLKALVDKAEYDQTYTRVPDLHGLRDYYAIRNRLRQSELRFNSHCGTLDPAKKPPNLGLVERQSPAPGTIVKKWTYVDCWRICSDYGGTGF